MLLIITLSSVTTCLSPSTPLLFHFWCFQPLIFSWDFPGDPLIPSSTPIKVYFFLSRACIAARMCLSLSCWVYHAKKLPVNVFLITCFYWKPWLPVLPPRLRVWPDWAPTSVRRAEPQPRPPHRIIITTPTGVYGRPPSR